MAAAQKDFTLVVYAQLQVTTTMLPDGYEGQTGYSAKLTASIVLDSNLSAQPRT